MDYDNYFNLSIILNSQSLNNLKDILPKECEYVNPIGELPNCHLVKVNKLFINNDDDRLNDIIKHFNNFDFISNVQLQLPLKSHSKRNTEELM